MRVERPENARLCALNPKLSTLNRSRTPPPAAPSLSALSRGRGGHCYVSTFNSAQPHICQHHRHINHKPTTLNHKPSTLNRTFATKSPCIAVRLHGNTGENHISCYPETVVYLSHARNNSFRTCVSASEKPTNRCFVHRTLFPPDGQFSLPPNIQILF